MGMFIRAFVAVIFIATNARMASRFSMQKNSKLQTPNLQNTQTHNFPLI